MTRVVGPAAVLFDDDIRLRGPRSHRDHHLHANTVEASAPDLCRSTSPRIEAENVAAPSPCKVYGLGQHGLVLRLWKRSIDGAILAGMLSNLCVQAQMQELLERGCAVAVVREATAGTIIAEGNGYLAVLINNRFMDNHLRCNCEAAPWNRAASSARMCARDPAGAKVSSFARQGSP
ncbi:MAG: isochorismatase family protein [Rhodobacter sp.]|nr:isochorismatase family protein [Rhodobacter sp.]